MAKKLDTTAQDQIAKLRAQQKTEKESAKAAKKAAKQNKGPGRFKQMKQVYDMTREHDKRVPWFMLGIILLGGLVGVAIGLLLSNWITFLILGLVTGVFIALMFMSRRAEKAAFAQMAGRPGAAGAAMSVLRRGWILKEEPVTVSPRHQDLVFMGIGRAGVVLVTDGPSARVRPLAEGVRRDVQRAVKNVPVTILHAGQADDQVALEDVAGAMKKLPKAISRQEVQAVDQRLSTLRLGKPPIPAGLDPSRMRPNRKALRGR